MDDKKERGPFYCDVCECQLKDSANYLDHINGKRHNRNKGINLKQFTDSTLEEVKEMLEKKRNERDERLNNIDKVPAVDMSMPGERDFYSDENSGDQEQDEHGEEQNDDMDNDR